GDAGGSGEVVRRRASRRRIRLLGRAGDQQRLLAQLRSHAAPAFLGGLERFDLLPGGVVGDRGRLREFHERGRLPRRGTGLWRQYASDESTRRKRALVADVEVLNALR